MAIQTRGNHERRGRRLALIGGALAVLALTAACTAGAAASLPSVAPPTPVPPASLATLPAAKPARTAASTASGPSVTVENFNFVPADLTVQAGATVTWTNHDDVPHTVTASDKSFGSQNIDTDGQFSFTFAKPGTYSYFCAIHPFMTAKVTVT